RRVRKLSQVSVWCHWNRSYASDAIRVASSARSRPGRLHLGQVDLGGEALLDSRLTFQEHVARWSDQERGQRLRGHGVVDAAHEVAVLKRACEQDAPRRRPPA